MADSLSILGSTISHYRIIEKLGGGGMGVVYKAVHRDIKPANIFVTKRGQAIRLSERQPTCHPNRCAADETQ